jgi:hypothetical protein
MNTHAVVGNATDDTAEVKAGALCFVSNFSIASGSVEVYVIDRDGDWVTQWRPGETLTNFRAKMVRKEHPMFKFALGSAAARGRAATLANAFTPKSEPEIDENDRT